MDGFIGCFVVHDRKIEFSGQHQFVQFRGVVFFKLYGNVRINLLESRKDPRQKIGAKIEGNAKSQASLTQLAVFVQIGFQLPVSVQDISCSFQIMLSECSRNQAFLGTRKDPGVKFLLDFV